MLTASVDILRHGILILINQILGDILHHELVRRARHPGMHKGGQIEKGRAIKRQLVVDELIRGVCVDSLDKMKEPRSTRAACQQQTYVRWTGS